jgi:type IV secretory pathway TrbD component
MGGAPRSYAILNGTLAAIVAFAGALLPGVILGIAGHVLGVSSPGVTPTPSK